MTGNQRALRSIRLATLAIGGAWLLGQVARDLTLPTALCFYIPSPVLALLLASVALVHAVRRDPRAAWLFGIASALPLLVSVAENRPGGPKETTDESSLRVVHWNVGHSLGTAAQRALLEERADLYVLAETPRGVAVGELRAVLGTGFELATFGNRAALGRGGLRHLDAPIDRDRTHLDRLEWTPPEGPPLTVLVADLPSELWVPRDPLLRTVNAWIDRMKPDLVVGDFNAPRRSRAFSDLPSGYRHAYEAAGSGIGYSWPEPLPFSSLDHTFFGDRITANRYFLRSTRASDHRMQVFEFAVR